MTLKNMKNYSRNVTQTFQDAKFSIQAEKNKQPYNALLESILYRQAKYIYNCK